MTEETIAAWVRWLRDPNRSYNPNAYELLADVLEKAVGAGGAQALSAGPVAPPLRESVAKAIYDQWAYQDGWVKWVDRGNSLRQDDARDLASLAIAASPTPPAEQPADELRHQLKLLADALAACIMASGIVRKDIDGFTLPQLLHFAADLRSMLEAAPKAAPAVPSGDELRKIARSARTSASDDASPTEYVLAGWRAALAAQGGA